MSRVWQTVLLVGALAAGLVAGADAQGAGGQRSEGHLVELIFQEAELRDIFASLADAAGWSFVALPDLTGRATLAVKGVTVEQAVEVVARATGFSYVVAADTLVVGTRASLQSRFDPSMVRPEEVGPPKPAAPATTELVRLDYVRAEAMKQLATMVVPEEAVRVDGASNLLVVRGTPEQLEAVRQLAASYDRPPAQVLIEARVEEIQSDAMEDLGIA